MAKLRYMYSATNETYKDSAFAYISQERARASISLTSTILGISAGAIAGAMAEENTAYDWSDEAFDIYARSGMDPTEAAVTLLPATAARPVVLLPCWWKMRPLFEGGKE